MVNPLLMFWRQYSFCVYPRSKIFSDCITDQDIFLCDLFAHTDGCLSIINRCFRHRQVYVMDFGVVRVDRIDSFDAHRRAIHV